MTLILVTRFLIQFLLLANALPAPSGGPTTLPSVNPPAEHAQADAAKAAITDRIVIISIDGCRPDLLLRANTPTVHALLPEATFTFWARTTPLAITLPSHTSMLTGVIPRKHEVEWNRDLKFAEPVYPKFPTIFEVAHRAGKTTAMVAGKSKFSVLNKPGTIDWPLITTDEKSEDRDVVSRAVEVIRNHEPQVLFVHLPSVDNAGHKYGWSSPEQMRAIEGADAGIAEILVALAERGLRQKTIVLITADHGGAGKTHLPDDARARHIPWILFGPGIRHGVDLTANAKTIVDTEDTFATASYLLGLPISPDIDGKPILEVLEKPVELIRSE